MAHIGEVVVGTYEKLILGYAINEDEDGKVKFNIVFTNNAHLAPVRCMALTPYRGILASAGSDEAIRLLDLKRRVEVGSLPYHSGSVNDLHFFKNSHLFSASDDGKLVVWRKRDWKMLKAFKRHKGQPVKGVSVHPSGALALTVGNDKTLRTWDIVAGKNAFAINLKKSANSVKWSPNGIHFALIFDHWIDVYLAETGKVRRSFPESVKANGKSPVSPSYRITTACFVSDDVLVFAQESGLLISASVIHNQSTQIQAHASRTKTLAVIPSKCENPVKLLSASSSGEIKLWEHFVPGSDSSPNGSFVCLASQQTNFRILSMVFWNTTDQSTSSKEAKTGGLKREIKNSSKNRKNRKIKKTKKDNEL